MSQNAPRPWSGPTKRWVVAGGVLVLGIILWQASSIIPQVALALLLAYLMNPVVDFLSRRLGTSHTLATILAYLGLLLVLFSLPLLFIPPLVGQIQSLNVDLQAIIDRLGALVAQYQDVEILGFTIHLSQVYEGLQSQLAGLLATFATQSLNILFGAASSIVWVVFILFVSFYIVKDAQRLSASVDRWTPPAYREELGQLRKEVAGTWNSFLRGQLVLSTTVGVATGLAVWVAGVPNALLLGLLAGILEVIPNLGPVISAIPAIVLAFFQGSTNFAVSNEVFALVVVGIYVVIQQLENNILVPRIIGESVNLPPAVVLVGAVVGANIAGLLGIFLASPVIATLRLIAEYIYDKILEPAPSVAAAVVADPLPSSPKLGAKKPGSSRRSSARRR